MALGEQRTGDGIGIDHFIFVKIGTGIGVWDCFQWKDPSRQHGCAGDIGHICVDKHGPICRCGNTGCLEAMAAGPAITEKAMQAAKNGASPFLRQMLETNGGILRPEDVNVACREGDQAALEIIRASGADDRRCAGRPGEFFQSQPYFYRRRNHEFWQSSSGCYPPGSSAALAAAGDHEPDRSISPAWALMPASPAQLPWLASTCLCREPSSILFDNRILS